MRNARKETNEMPDELIKIRSILITLLAERKDDSFGIGIKKLKTFALEELEKPIVLNIIDMLIDVGLDAVKKGLEDQTKIITNALGKIGEKAIEKRWNNVPEDIKIKCKELKSGTMPIGYGVEQYDRAATDIASALREIGMEIVEKGWTGATQSVADTFKNLYVKAKKEQIENLILIRGCFETFITASMGKDMDFAVEYTIKSFKDAFTRIIESDLDSNKYTPPMWSLQHIIKKSTDIIKKEKPEIARWMEGIIDYLVEIGIKAENARVAKKYIRDELRKLISCIVDEIGEIKDYVPDHEDSIGGWIDTYIIKSSLGNAGLNISARDGFYFRNYQVKNPEDAIEWIAVCLIDIGVKTVNKEFDSATKSVIKFLVGIEKNCKEIGHERLIEDVFETYHPQTVEEAAAFEAFKKLRVENLREFLNPGG